MNSTARTRASTYVHLTPEPKSRVVEVLIPNDPVEVRGDAGEMVEIVAKRLLPPVVGYVSKSALVTRIPPVEIFPMIQMEDGTTLNPAPADLLAIEFEAWLHTQGEPTWLFEDGNAPFVVGDQMRMAFDPYRPSWSEWFAEVISNNRMQTATFGEWMTIVSGGKEMWSFRPERICKEPAEGSATLGWVNPTDILHWTGRVRYSEKETKYKVWHEVELTKLDRTIKGWYKAVILEDFIYPEVYVESNDRAGIAALFDMTQAQVRLPADPEIEEARAAKRNSVQYLNIQNATGKNIIHKNLCGEFCVAALCGTDVIPLLAEWYRASKRGKTVLDGGVGTYIYDLQEILNLYHIPSELFRPEQSVAPATPGYLEKMLHAGKKAIINVGLSYKGEVSYNGIIRHWLVVEDIVRMGNSGWVRVYNSFFNQEEVYPYQRLFNTGIATGIGLWVNVAEIKG